MKLKHIAKPKDGKIQVFFKVTRTESFDAEALITAEEFEALKDAISTCEPPEEDSIGALILSKYKGNLTAFSTAIEMDY